MPISNEVGEKNKLYSKKEVGLAAFFGGPLASFYMISKNFEALGNKDSARRYFGVGVLILFITGVILSMISEETLDKIPNVAISIAFTMAALYIVESSQVELINKHIKNGGEIHSGWNVVGIVIVSLLAMVLFFVSIGFLIALLFGAI